MLPEGRSNVGLMPGLRTDGPGFARLTHLRQKRLKLEGNVMQLSLILFAIEMCHEGEKEKHARTHRLHRSDVPSQVQSENRKLGYVI